MARELVEELLETLARAGAELGHEVCQQVELVQNGSALRLEVDLRQDGAGLVQQPVGIVGRDVQVVDKDLRKRVRMALNVCLNPQ